MSRTNVPARFAVIVSFLIGSAARGHDVWLSPERFTLEKGDTLTVRQLVGHDLKSDTELPFLRALTGRFEWITAAGSVDLLEELQDGSSPLLRRKLHSEGLVLLVLEQRFRQVELSPSQFADHLKHEGLEEILKLWRKRGRKKVERERFARTIKCVVRVGDAQRARRFREITDEDLGYLRGVPVPALDLVGTHVTDSGLAHLRGAGDLKTLELPGTRVTDAGLVHLGSLGSLQTLNLERTSITDAGLAHLEGLTGLKELNLAATKVTGAGIAHLTGLKNLERLYLSGPELVARARASLTESARVEVVKLEARRPEKRMPAVQLLRGRLDLRVLQNPFLLRPGDEIEVKVLFDGEALRQKTVRAQHRDGRRFTELEARTDDRGLARFRLESSGLWLLRLVHMLPCEEPDIDWESYWAAWTLRVE